MNKWFLGVLSIGVSVLGFHLGSRQVEEKTPILKIVRMGEESSDLQRELKRSPSEKTIDKKKLSLKNLKRLPQSQGARAGEKEREEQLYFRAHLADRENLKIYIRTKNLFQDYETKEFMARWMVLGNFFSSSKFYEELFASSVRKLNEDPKRTLEVLQKSMDKMGQEDSFLRGMR